LRKNTALTSDLWIINYAAQNLKLHHLPVLSRFHLFFFINDFRFVLKEKLHFLFRCSCHG
jgi:hypothetical protein